MTNENNTNAPRPLTDAEKASREAALAKATGGAKVQVPGNAVPGNAVTVNPVTVDHKPVAPTVTGPAQKPISELVKAATTALGNTDNPAKADAAVAALATATALPVNLAKVASTEPATKAAVDKLLADKLVKVEADNAAHKVAIANANANVGKPQGGTVTKGKGPATPTVAAAKPAKLTPRETALANDKLVRGYDFSKWPKAMAAIMPTANVIDAVRSTVVLKTLITKTELALCAYAMPGAQRFNVYDVATALQNVLGGSHDHKMNTVNQKAVLSGMWVRLNPAARAVGLTDGKNLIAYAVGPSAKGLIKIRAALGDKTPKHWLPENGQGKPADKGKGTPATGTPAGA